MNNENKSNIATNIGLAASIAALVTTLLKYYDVSTPLFAISAAAYAFANIYKAHEIARLKNKNNAR
jgi:hypothetical protein